MPGSCRLFRILAIDDDEDDQVFLQRWVRRTETAPFVQLMSSALAARSFLEALPSGSQELPHVILCDIKMPGIDGFDFLQWLRQSRHKNIPIVMRSCSPISSDVARAYQLGANSYVVKKDGLDAMDQRLSDLIHYWRDIAEVPGS